MLATMKRYDFETLVGVPLIWACIEPTIGSVRGKNLADKSDVYAQLTRGQQALLMFQILYGHTLHGVKEFFFYQSYMLSNKGVFLQLIDGMNYFGASEIVQVLYELLATYEEYRDEMEVQKLQFGNVDKDSKIYVSLSRLDGMLQKCLPMTINLICSCIRNNAGEFVTFVD